MSEVANDNIEAVRHENRAAEYVAAAREDHLAEVMPEQETRGFFSWAGSLENLGGHMARAVDIALNAVIGFFVDEPKLTAGQVHETLQAAGNLETLHARDYAAGVAVEAAAHEGRMLAMKGDQQTHDVRLAETLGINATAEATIGIDEHEGARRSQKLSL